MIANVQGYEWRLDPITKKPVRVPVPFDCGCGNASHYGKDNRWYCTQCWQFLHKGQKP